MSEKTPIVFGPSPGQAAYAAWCDEFGPKEDPWHELTVTTQEAWDEIAERVATDTVILPVNGFEVTVRTRNGTLTFAWVGQADHQMHSMMMTAISRAATGEA